MKAGQGKADRTDTLPGVLRGHEFECKCTVVLTSNVNRQKPGIVVKSGLRITASDVLPPDGIYDLSVRGRVFKVRRQGGEWPTVPL